MTSDIAAAVVQLVARVALAVPFWRSGILKWDGFLRLNETAVTLFRDEFMLHLPGGPYGFPAPAVFAFLAGCCEIIFPVLLIIGLGTRFAALGLLLMTVVVELTVPEGWPVHLTWAALAFGIMMWGPGALSVDAIPAVSRWSRRRWDRIRAGWFSRLTRPDVRQTRPS